MLQTGEFRLADYIQHHYGLQVKKAKHRGGRICLKTDGGYFELQPIATDHHKRVNLWVDVAKQLEDYYPLQAPVATVNGKYVFKGLHQSYVLLPWLHAKTLPFHSRDDWQIATRSMAAFHHASKNVSLSSTSYRKYQQTGKWYAHWRNAYRQIELYQLAANMTTKPTNTDYSWLEFADLSTQLMEDLLAYYQRIDGDRICYKTRSEGKVCHGNLQRNNILFDSEGQIHLTDWRHIVLDVRAFDLAKWLHYAYGQTGNLRIVPIVLHAYREEHSLQEEEYALIYAQLLYPSYLIRVLHDIYRDQSLPISSGAPSILSALKFERRKINILSEFPHIIQQEFGKRIPPFKMK